MGERCESRSGHRDLDAYLALTGPDCRSCRQYAERTTAIYETGGHVMAGDSSVDAIHHDGGAQWTVSLTSEPSDVVESKGAEPQYLDGGRYSLTVYLSHAGGEWSVATYLGNPT